MDFVKLMNLKWSGRRLTEACLELATRLESDDEETRSSAEEEAMGFLKDLTNLGDNKALAHIIGCLGVGAHYVTEHTISENAGEN